MATTYKSRFTVINYAVKTKLQNSYIHKLYYNYDLLNDIIFTTVQSTDKKQLSINDVNMTLIGRLNTGDKT